MHTLGLIKLSFIYIGPILTSEYMCQIKITYRVCNKNYYILTHRRELFSKFTEERNWHQFHTPRNMLLDLVGEVGELSEIL